MAHDDGSFWAALRAAREGAPGSRRRLILWVIHLASGAFGLLVGAALIASGVIAWLEDEPGKMYAFSGGAVFG